MKHSITPSTSLLARGLVLGGLLCSALWLTGCSTSSYFVVRDSHHYRRSHSHSYYYEREYCERKSYGHGRDRGRGHHW